MLSDTISAGLLMYRWNKESLEVLLSHPGGPLYRNKDNGHWGIPKGQVEPNETILAAAFREFSEETGLNPEVQKLLPLGRVVEAGGKAVYAWAFQGDCDTDGPVRSNLFELEWPPNSGRIELHPEVDRLGFFAVDAALLKVERVQRRFITHLERQLIGGHSRQIAL